MRPFRQYLAPAAPLPLANVNTDDILPARFMKTLTRQGLGRHLFAEMRYRPDGSEEPGFVLNQPPFRDAGILIAHANFGCGSSREHAVWALDEFGIRCVISPSFASIFSSNCLKNGLLLIEAPADACDALIAEAMGHAGQPMAVDLEARSIRTPAGRTTRFDIDPVRRRLLIEGLDDIERTLRHADAIADFERKRTL